MCAPGQTFVHRHMKSRGPNTPSIEVAENAIARLLPVAVNPARSIRFKGLHHESKERPRESDHRLTLPG
jgi:hypothetical protein